MLFKTFVGDFQLSVVGISFEVARSPNFYRFYSFSNSIRNYLDYSYGYFFWGNPNFIDSTPFRTALEIISITPILVYPWCY